MASLNKFFGMGNLTRNPELRFTKEGKPVTKFGLAINRKYKQDEVLKDEVCYIDINVWGNRAESCKKYLKKGSAVHVEGRLNFRTWQNNDGTPGYKHEITASNVQFLPNANNDFKTKQNEVEEITESEEISEPEEESPFKEDVELKEHSLPEIL